MRMSLLKWRQSIQSTLLTEGVVSRPQKLSGENPSLGAVMNKAESDLARE